MIEKLDNPEFELLMRRFCTAAPGEPRARAKQAVLNNVAEAFDVLPVELKECPFCGSAAKPTGGSVGDITIQTARCSKPDCIAAFKSVDVGVWNNRVAGS